MQHSPVNSCLLPLLQEDKAASSQIPGILWNLKVSRSQEPATCSYSDPNK